MDQTHLHLLITHLPIFGSLLGTLVLGFGMWKKSGTTILASYYVLMLSTFGAGIAYLTGESAEETVENLPGVSEYAIEQHADFALYALLALIAVGIAAAVGGVLFNTTKNAFAKPVAQVTLFLALLSFGLVARTGYLGGQIRHTEIKSINAQNTGEQGSEQHHEDD